MTDECISPLRRRMIEDMTVRNFVAKTTSVRLIIEQIHLVGRRRERRIGRAIEKRLS